MLSDWESDLTELSSSEEEDATYAPAPKTKKTPNKNEYQVTHSLKRYRTVSYSVRSLYEKIVDNTVDLEPEYQRDVVWPESKQIGLIDSIMRNIYIPPIIFALKAHEDGSETRTCIDGKQRLTSIQKFMDGMICHKDTFSNHRMWFKNSDGQKKRPLLPKQVVQNFENKQVTCIEYDELNDDQEREIFQRVQLGVALTPAERMQALNGPRSALIREVQAKVENLSAILDWSSSRGREFQCVASIIFLIEKNDGSFPGAAQLDKWLQRTDLVSSNLRTEVHETFKIFHKISQDDKLNRCFKEPTRVSPVEFTMTGVLIYGQKSNLSLVQLCSAISKLREDVRRRHVDIRSNGKVVKTMWTFLKKGIDKTQLKSDGKGDKPAVSIKDAPLPSSISKPVKRKRVVASDTEDSDVPLTKATARRTAGDKPKRLIMPRKQVASRSKVSSASLSNQAALKASSKSASTSKVESSSRSNDIKAKSSETAAAASRTGTHITVSKVTKQTTGFSKSNSGNCTVLSSGRASSPSSAQSTSQLPAVAAPDTHALAASSSSLIGQFPRGDNAGPLSPISTTPTLVGSESSNKGDRLKALREARAQSVVPIQFRHTATVNAPNFISDPLLTTSSASISGEMPNVHLQIQPPVDKTQNAPISFPHNLADTVSTVFNLVFMPATSSAVAPSTPAQMASAVPGTTGPIPAAQTLPAGAALMKVPQLPAMPTTDPRVRPSPSTTPTVPFHIPKDFQGSSAPSAPMYSPSIGVQREGSGSTQPRTPVDATVCSVPSSILQQLDALSQSDKALQSPITPSKAGTSGSMSPSNLSRRPNALPPTGPRNHNVLSASPSLVEEGPARPPARRSSDPYEPDRYFDRSRDRFGGRDRPDERDWRDKGGDWRGRGRGYGRGASPSSKERRGSWSDRRDHSRERTRHKPYDRQE